MSTRERTYEFIRQGILLGDFPGGTFIEEEAISQKIGVSRTPVREAFHQLNAERYITLVPRKGALVRETDIRELPSLFDARLVIELFAVERICVNKINIPSELRSILRTMEAMEEIESASSHLRFMMLNWDFHLGIVALIENNVLSEMYNSIQSRFHRVARSMPLSGSTRLTIESEHREILRLLENAEVEKVSSIIKSHLKTSINV